MPPRKTDATKDDVAAPGTPDASEEIRPEAEAASPPESGALPPAGAESEPAPQPPAEPAEAAATVTVDEAAAGEPAGAGAEAAPPEPLPDAAPEPLPERAPEEAPAQAEERRAEADREAEHHEEHAEEEEGWSLPARVLTALVLLLAGAALGIWAAPKIAPVLPSGMKPVADWLTPGAGAAEEEIAALRTELGQGISGVETRLAALPSPDDLDRRIAAAVDGARGELAGEIDALRQAVGQVDPTAARQQLDRLDTALKRQEAELSALKEQLAGATAASGQLSDEAIENLNVYNAEVQGLRAEMGTLQDRVSALAARIDEVAASAEREIATAQTRVGEIQSQAATALGAAETGAAVALVRAALASGQPFADALGQLEGRPGISIPAGLTDAAGSGVPTLAQLRDGFPDAAHAAIRASIMASAGDGVLARSRAFLEAQVASRSLTPQTGMSPDAVLSRVEDRLRRDDLAGALAEADGLPSEAKAAMQGWLDAARLRLGAEQGLAALEATHPATTN